MLPILGAFVNIKPLYFLRPSNAPHVVACAVYRYDRPPHQKIAVSNRNQLLTTPPAIAWDADIVQRLDADGVTLLCVRLKTAGVTYFSTLEILCRHGRYQDRHGLQLVMTLGYWSVELPDVEQPRAPEPEQLTLFGGAL